MMFLSIIIPTFNRSHTINRAIESVLNQTYKNYELIVIDDGSVDNTKEILSNYDIKYYFQKNSGVSGARNLGIKKASAKWIAFLDSDDSWHKTKLEEQVNFHKQNPEFLISQTDERWIKDGIFTNKPKKYRKKDGNIFKHSIDICSITASSVLIHRSIFDDIGYFDENLKVCEDYDMWIRISKKYMVGLIDKCLIDKFGGANDQLSVQYFAMNLFRLKALRKHLNLNNKYINDAFNKKYKILENGAKKHNNTKLLKELEWLKN